MRGPEPGYRTTVAKPQLIEKAEHKSAAVGQPLLPRRLESNLLGVPTGVTAPVMCPPSNLHFWQDSQVGNTSEVSICIRNRELRNGLILDSLIKEEAFSCGHFYVIQMVQPVSMMFSQFREYPKSADVPHLKSWSLSICLLSTEHSAGNS